MAFRIPLVLFLQIKMPISKKSIQQSSQWKKKNASGLRPHEVYFWSDLWSDFCMGCCGNNIRITNYVCIDLYQMQRCEFHYLVLPAIALSSHSNTVNSMLFSITLLFLQLWFCSVHLPLWIWAYLCVALWMMQKSHLAFRASGLWCRICKNPIGSLTHLLFLCASTTFQVFFLFDAQTF